MENKKKAGILEMCGYSAASIFEAASVIIISMFFTAFLSKSLGMSTVLAGVIVLIGKFWDALTDPIMGFICDRTYKKIGSKRFYILIGSFFAAITFILMWIPLRTSNAAGQFIFYLLMYLLFSTAYTMVMVPYNGLLPDMVKDYNERSRYSSVRSIMASFGAVVAGIVPSIFLKNATDSYIYLLVAVICAIAFFITIIITVLTTSEKCYAQYKSQRNRRSIMRYFRAFTVCKTKVFRSYLVMYMAGRMSGDFVSGLLIYYIDDSLHMLNGAKLIMFTAANAIGEFIGTFFACYIARKMEKTMPLFVGFVIRVVALVAILFFSTPDTSVWIIVGLIFVSAFGFGGSRVTGHSILADMTEVDELVTTIHRPGSCGAMYSFSRKVCAGVASCVIGILLAVIGYNEAAAVAGSVQSAGTQSGIILLFVLIPLALTIISMIYAIRFPMKSKDYDIMVKEINRRRGKDESTITPEEISVCEKITGFKYEDLWTKRNVYLNFETVPEMYRKTDGDNHN